MLGAGDFQHALAQAFGAGDGAAFHQIGDHGQVGAAFLCALVDRAYALPDFQADVPQQRQKPLDGFTENFVVVAVQQDQQVDVRVRMQLAAPVATHCQKRDVGVFTPFELIPGLLQDVIDKPCPVLDQSSNVTARPEALIKDVSRSADGLLERSDGAGFQGQFGLELATIEQVWIYLRH